MLAKSLLNCFYPNKCIFCRKFLLYEEGYICDLCLAQLQIQQDYYFKNETLTDETEGMKIPGLEEEEVEKQNPIIAVMPYNKEYRQAILRWKYKGIRKYANGFADLVVARLKALDLMDIEYFIPVPLSPSHKKKRGFNQAKDLVEGIVKHYPAKVLDCLIRNRETKPQSACSKEERYYNVKDSMEANKKVIDKEFAINQVINKIALIDDIYTTGSTINESIRALMKEKCFKDAKIYIIILARGSL